MLMIIAVWRFRKYIGIMKLIANMNLKNNVDIVLSQMFFSEIFFVAASSEIWIPNESESPSAIAIINTAPMINDLEWVPEFNPIINPRVVIIPEVNPKPNPFFIDDFMW